MNWSWEALKSGMGSALNNPQGLMENPWFQGGMGLLSENTKPYGGDWTQGLLGGMYTAKNTEQERKDRERMEKLRRELYDWFMQQQGRAVTSPQGGIMSPVSNPPPQSIMNLRRTTP